jgi:hypothetical protein
MKMAAPRYLWPRWFKNLTLLEGSGVRCGSLIADTLLFSVRDIWPEFNRSRRHVAAMVNSFAASRSYSRSAWRRHEAHVDHFKPEADDPLHEPGKGCLIWQLGAKGCGARADGDLAVVEFRAQRGTCLAPESDLICL